MASNFFTEDEKKIQEKYRKLAEELILPREKEIDEKDRIPPDLIKQLTGDPFYLPSLSVPQKYGGLELSNVKVGIIAEEIGYACPTLIPFLEIAQLYSHVIKLGGSEEQKKKFLGALAQGKIGAYALTDEGPGSDPARMKTIAVKRGTRYYLTGKKRIITYADLADLIAVFASEDPEAGAKGISAFIIEKKGIKGIKFERRIDTFGLRGHRAFDIVLKEVEVPEENRIGKSGEGLKLALKVLNITRISLAWGFIGLARRALEETIKWVKEREVAGKKLKEFSNISFAIAEIATQIDAARLLAYRASSMADRGMEHRKETSMAKWYAGEIMLKAVDLANRVYAGYGADPLYPVEKFLRDAYTWHPAQGTNEVQKFIIARELLK